MTMNKAVNKAVRALRKHVKKTQQIFATELGMSISALQNYEQSRMPEPKQLLKFQRYAGREGRVDLQEVFRLALMQSLALGPDEGPIGSSVFSTADSFDSIAVGALLRAIHKSPPSPITAIRGIVEVLRQWGDPDSEAFAKEAVERGLLNEPTRRKKD